jgi:hypothetical protein
MKVFFEDLAEDYPNLRSQIVTSSLFKCPKNPAKKEKQIVRLIDGK